MASYSDLGAKLVSYEPFTDDRGVWQRLFDSEILKPFGCDSGAAQVSVSKNPKKGTLRGMHSLDEAYGEVKVVLCLSGSVQDIVLDARRGSKTYGTYKEFTLDAENHNAVVIPPGCAHGFLTLEKETNLLYLMSKPYDSSREVCFRWNDPFWGVEWAFEPTLVSAKDQAHDLV